ncbi:GDSL-type esterase/lipase family protein [Aestuariispira ectoiniformans]|uniref:GDSL-type esterase/lipase family protein n=1 Tax=Aestuariispira ectoiniformans TaxID=2775080 RepID=UPI00223C0279|nr:GDSL-type esterase/lipase family protein [Aestuariispira ectoiniformans]
MTTIRICYVGDSVTVGTGDDDCLGWPGRLSAAETGARGHDVSCYNLGIRAETSSQIRARWQQECAPRLPAHVKAGITFMFGLNDCALDNGQRRVSLQQSLENARSMLSDAQAQFPVLWLGPTPVRSDNPVISPGKGVRYEFSAERVAELNQAFAGLAKELGLPYLDCHEHLAGQDVWNETLAAGDGVHPTATGYMQLAMLIENWPAWRAWFSI